MIEGKVSGESAYIARTYGRRPEGGRIYFLFRQGEHSYDGDFAKVRVTGALEYDLIGEVYDESAQ